MEEIQYIGEFLAPRYLGHIAVITSFCAALLAVISYSAATNNSIKNINADSWLKLGRFSFILHGISIFTIIGVLFYVMWNHMYEYRYAWEHVNDDLDLKYVLSAFWEGQEGSFLLWMFWHVVLGFILMYNAKKWEAPVLAMLALIELVITTMILGVHIEIGDFVYKIGSNPTLLLRETMNIPIFQNAEYVELLDGNGLNPLLQNYWMTIHPPTLFLGFASLSIPFCFSIAGLWTRNYKESMTAMLNWSLFAAGIFGSGILMGGAWAYVALSFGGYWAWDPVENASLVPWLTLVAGLHTNYIAKSTGYSLKPTYILYIISFLLVLYSTFLTRSGVLGDTSVHAFTEMGLEWQLVLLIVVFLVVGLYFYITRSRDIPAKEKEESIYSREFWMFIGSLVLLFSALIISGSTSLPVFNKIMTYFDPDFIGKVIKDPIPHYNRYQLWIAIAVSLLSAVTLFMRYRSETSSFLNKKFLRHMLTASIGSILFIIVYRMFYNLGSWNHHVLLFACVFSIIASIDYLVSVLRGQLKLGASAISHLGFSLMIIGSLCSGLNEYHISKNSFVFGDFFNEEEAGKYVKLIKNKPLFMNNQWVTYTSDTLVNHTRIYDVAISDSKDDLSKAFILNPNIVYAKGFEKVASTNPSTRHFFDRDVFTNIAALHPSLMDSKFAKEMEDTIQFDRHVLAIDDTLVLGNQTFVLENLTLGNKHKELIKSDSQFGISADVKVSDITRQEPETLKPALGLKGNLIYNFPQKSQEMELLIKLDDKLFDQYFTPEDKLVYKEYTIKETDSFKSHGYDFKLTGFDREPKQSQYVPVEEDIAVAAILECSKDGKQRMMEPIYVIRGDQPMSIKDYLPEEGLHVRFSNIDPVTGAFSFKVALDNRNITGVPLMIAQNVDRTDYIIFEARVFPGISLFWLGSCLMLFGLFMALHMRRKNKS